MIYFILAIVCIAAGCFILRNINRRTTGNVPSGPKQPGTTDQHGDVEEATISTTADPEQHTAPKKSSNSKSARKPKKAADKQ